MTPALPWFGCGEEFLRPVAPREAFVSGVGARRIATAPVVAWGAIVPGYKALVGTYEVAEYHGSSIHHYTKQVPLSVVSKSYGVLQDSEFFQILEKVYQGRAVVETAGTLRGGRRVWALAKHDAFEVVKDDRIETYDLWLNTHDGSSCFELHRTNVRVVCANTWRQAIGRGKNRVLGVPHRPNVLANAQAAIAQAAIAQLIKANEAEAHSRAELERLASTRVDTDGAVEVFNRLLEINPDEATTPKVQKSLDTLVELFNRGTGNEGATRWDVFNAVTEFVDHRRTIRVGEGRDRREARFESAVLGNGDDLKAKAYDLLLTV